MNKNGGDVNDIKTEEEGRVVKRSGEIEEIIISCESLRFRIPTLPIGILIKSGLIPVC